MIISLSNNKFTNFFRKDWLLLLIISIISLIVHYAFFAHPGSVVFDEVHIGRFIVEYLKGNYLFDVHPPLGRLIFLFFAYIIGADTITDFSQIGNALPEWALFLRIVPTFAGALLPVIIYGILRLLNISKFFAFIAGLLICLENSLIVHSRFLLTDSLLLMFGFLSILIYLLYIKYENKIKYSSFIFFLSIIFACFAFSIKWTGLSFLFLILVFEIQRRGIRKSIKSIFASFIIFFTIYSFIISIHFTLLPNSGTGDDFMVPAFQKTLIGNRFVNDNNLQPIGFWNKFYQLNREMLNANLRISKTHSYTSEWYTWPVQYRSIYYWTKVDPINPEIASHIYLIGNPLLYLASLISILYLLNFTLKNKISKIIDAEVFVVLGFLINFIPFMFIGRIMFLYHYEVALIFGLMAIPIVINKIENLKLRDLALVSIIFISFILFIYFSPLTYGLPITNDQLNAHLWLKTWR